MTKKIFVDEQSIYNFWEKSDFFRADPNSSKKSYSLLVPPPNLTGELHLGHAMQHAILDAVARFRRLLGFDVLLLPGVDHAGIQFEATFDRELKKQNLSKEKLGREEWLKKAWEFKEKIYQSVSGSWRLLGLSADWSREIFSLDAGPQRAVYEQFKTYFEKGLIYRGPYIVQWCPKDQTAIEDVEMEYEERDEKLYFVRYLIEGGDKDFIEIATTRPETIFADSGIAVYPKHPQFQKYIGKGAYIPLPLKKGRVVPIFEDERIDKDFGTGALKITPGHDILDYEIGKTHGLPTYQAVDKSGRMTGDVGKLAGLTVSEAREAAVEMLSKNGALVATRDYKHAVAVCERCKTVVEPLISEEWFVKVEGMAKEAIKIIDAGKIKFLPNNYAKILKDWFLEIHDWCISRSLWWGQRIPVWYPSTHSINSGSSTRSGSGEMKVSLESPGRGWQQDEQVLDTWFSSGLWPLSTLGWPDGTGPVATFPPAGARSFKNEDDAASNVQELRAVGRLSSRTTRSKNIMLDRYFPWDFEISAGEIKFLWIARMIMIGQYLSARAPFKTMFFHGMLRDLQGRKFSKSLGNGIEPVYLVEKWGVDATRMALYTYSVPGRDGRVSKQILDERAKNFRNFVTKVRNIARYILELKPKDSKQKLEFASRDDQWIKRELEKTIAKVTNHLENIELHLATDEIYNFIWHQFADTYIEKSKKRRADAQMVLEYVLKNCLILMHPFMPFVSEEIYQQFEDKKQSIMLEEWPVAG